MNLNNQAAQTLVSHLRAQNCEAVADQNVVTISSGRRQVRLTTDTGYGPKRIDAQDLCSCSAERIQKALNWVKKAAKLDFQPQSVYRHVEASRNTLGDNFDDILFRSKTFARCPNPAEADIKKYAPLVKRIAKHVWGRFRRPLLAFGFESEDMESYGLVHLTTALHRYRTGDVKYDDAIIGRYVTQRLMEIVRKVKRKGLQCTADSEVRSWVELQNC